MSNDASDSGDQVDSWEFEEKPIKGPDKEVLCNVQACPKQWDALKSSENRFVLPGKDFDDFERYCEVCQRPVYWAESVQEVMERARAGECIAVPVDESGVITLRPKRKRILVGSPDFSNFENWDAEDTRYPY